MQQGPDPGHELDEERLVQPQLLADPDDVVRGCRVPGNDCGGVAGAQMQKREDEQRDDHHHRDRRENAPDDVGEHALGFEFVIPAKAGI